MITEADGVFLISSYQVWRPGAYDSKATAQYAFRFDDEDLIALQNSLNPNGIITMAHLKALRKRKTPIHP